VLHRVGLCILLLLFGQVAAAQMGIGTLHPHPSAQLEIRANHRGLLIPRVALQGRHDFTTITAGNTESLLVYNTTHSSTLSPGFYYWHNQEWHRLLTRGDFPGNLVFWDPDAQELHYRAADGSIGTLPLSTISETVTVLELSPDKTTLRYTDEQGNTTAVNLKAVVQQHQKYAELIDGNHTTVTASTQGNTTTYQVNVPVATPGTSTAAAQLGLVKERATNPAITIAQNGALLLNSENINAIKVVTQDYAITTTDKIILGNTSATDLTVTLPNPTALKGKIYIIRKENSGEEYYLYVQGQISGVPNGQPLYTAIPYTGWRVVSDGNEWRIITKF